MPTAVSQPRSPLPWTVSFLPVPNPRDCHRHLLAYQSLACPVFWLDCNFWEGSSHLWSLWVFPRPLLLRVPSRCPSAYLLTVIESNPNRQQQSSGQRERFQQLCTRNSHKWSMWPRSCRCQNACWIFLIRFCGVTRPPMEDKTYFILDPTVSGRVCCVQFLPHVKGCWIAPGQVPECRRLRWPSHLGDQGLNQCLSDLGISR